jgi:hypothetical protein
MNQHLLNRRRCNLSTVLVEWKHHGNPVPKGKIVPCEVESLAALIGPDRADARPNLLAILVFACVPAVIEDVGWCVWH